jgi:DNA-binding CsgD family transcriptional regulator
VSAAAEALRAIRTGNVLLNSHAAARMLAEYASFAGPGAPAGAPHLTEDERRVVSLVADGSPATAVAVAARLPPHKARNLLRNAVAKLQAHVRRAPSLAA